MSADARVVIRDAIERLEALAEILRRDANGRQTPPQSLSPEERTRKEIDLSIRVLLPKLRAAHVGDEAPEPPRGRVCLDCED